MNYRPKIIRTTPVHALQPQTLHPNPTQTRIQPGVKRSVEPFLGNPAVYPAKSTFAFVASKGRLHGQLRVARFKV